MTEAVEFWLRTWISVGIFSTTMSQQPALRAVNEIGENAIQNYLMYLRNHPVWRMRMYAVYCISGIDGPSAVRALNKPWPSQSGACVKQFVQYRLKLEEQAAKNTRHKLLVRCVCVRSLTQFDEVRTFLKERCSNCRA